MLSSINKRILLISSSILLIIIIAGLIVILIRLPRSQPIEIVEPPPPEVTTGSIVIDGAVSNPGIYSIRPGDTIFSLLQAAGGMSTGADISAIRLYIPEQNESTGPQRIDLNHAGVWLLEALPGIGETLASRIIEYREKNGPFHSFTELTQVKGITENTLQNIKNYITVSN